MAGGANEAQKEKAGGRRGVVLIAAAAIVVLAAGGGAAWYFLGRQQSPAAPETTAAVRKPAMFMDLEQFTVNLADAGGDRFAQVGLVLELGDTKAAEPLKADMPRLRNDILLLLTSKTGDELLTVAGKQKLAEEIAVIAGASAGWAPGNANRANPVTGVHFSKFIVQ